MTTPTALPVVLDLERQLVACVLKLPATDRAIILGNIRSEDLADPIAALILGWIARLTESGQPVGLLEVFEHAREHGDDGPASGWADRLARLGNWLADTYTLPTVADGGHALWLVEHVLHDAYRRAVLRYATRLAQAAETCSMAELCRHYRDTTEINHIARRLRTLTSVPVPVAQTSDRPDEDTQDHEHVHAHGSAA
jgi:hypothetical protein